MVRPWEAVLCSECGEHVRVSLCGAPGLLLEGGPAETGAAAPHPPKKVCDPQREGKRTGGSPLCLVSWLCGDGHRLGNLKVGLTLNTPRRSGGPEEEGCGRAGHFGVQVRLWLESCPGPAPHSFELLSGGGQPVTGSTPLPVALQRSRWALRPVFFPEGRELGDSVSGCRAA